MSRIQCNFLFPFLQFSVFLKKILSEYGWICIQEEINIKVIDM